jgi:hypothetical protein
VKRVELEVYSETSNHAIVRPPGRRFPGSVIQGDSLSILCAEAQALSERIRALQVTDEELLYLAQTHQEKLLDRLLHYQQVLLAHGISLPYEQPAQASDLVVLVDDTNREES